MIEQLAIYGAGGFSREVAWIVDACNKIEHRYELVCFIDDSEKFHGKRLNEIPVMSFEEASGKFQDLKVVSGIGNPKTRQKLMDKVAASSLQTTTLIYPDVQHSRWVTIGEGTVICAGNLITTNITIGRHVQINLDCTIGHDVILDDYSTLAPGVHVSGYVTIGKRAYIGTGAVFINGTEESPLIIEDDVIVGAGACVTKSVKAGLTVVGVPAKPISK